MAPLEGDTLGQKQRHFNRLVQEAVSKNAAADTLSGDDDIDNLLKIDLACKQRNVDFLLNIFKSDDTLYVSRAIKKSKWFIVDNQYSHIVNPAYLYTELIHEMNSKSFNKLLLSVRLNLRYEQRVESFYAYIGERNRAESFKWLQHCSILFIEKEVKNHYNIIPINYLRRLVERNISVFEVIMKTSYCKMYQLLTDTTFLVKVDTERYLKALEPMEKVNIKFSAKSTDILLEICPNRIIDNFQVYAKNIHMPTFAKYLNARQELQSFLLKQSENSKTKWLFTLKHIEHFLKYMSRDEKFAFAKKIYIDQDIARDGNGVVDKSLCGIQYINNMDLSRGQSDNTYEWYKYAPFDKALPDLKTLIQLESSPATRNLILHVLLSCAGKNMNNVRTVLKYYFDKHINEPFKFKIQFINVFISNTNSHEFDSDTWSMLNQLFQSMEVYVESHNNTTSCIKTILVRHVTRAEEVPEIIKDKFSFETLKEYLTKLKKQEDKDAVFDYLNKYLISKHDALKINTQSDLSDAITLCENQLKLWNDWKKDLRDFKFLKEKVTSLIAINREKSWNSEMKSLYNFNKVWKRVLFNESIMLHPCQEVCINALKHDPALLARNTNEVEAILKNDVIVIKNLLSKIRIYWSTSLAEEWKKLYLGRLDKPGGHKSLVNGLCALLPPQQLKEFAQKYAPSESKIDWNEIDELTISLQKQIAKRLSTARPLTSLETVILYAKGDYLQFAGTSLDSILSQMSRNKIREYLPILWNSPVSLKKFGVRYAFRKLSTQELKPTIKQIWNSTKNSSIRTVLFTHTRALLCKEKNSTNIEDLWEILSMFIDNLSTEENKDIYKKMSDISRIPASVQPQYFTKCFMFLKALPAKANCESILEQLKQKSPYVMEWLDEDFVINVLLKNIDENFKTNTDNMYDNAWIIAAFMLSCQDEAAATRRYEMFLGPLLDRNLPDWNHIHDNAYCLKYNLKQILETLVHSLEDENLKKNMNVPVKCYENVLSQLENSLQMEKEYCLITTWKLTVAFIREVEKHKGMIQRDKEFHEKYRKLHEKMAPGFAKATVDLLKNDLEKFNPFIYVLFAKAFYKFFNSYLIHTFADLFDELIYLKVLLRFSNDKEVYLIVQLLLEKYISGDYEEECYVKEFKVIRKILYSHPAMDMKAFYYQMYARLPDVDIEK